MTGKLLVDGNHDLTIPELPAFSSARGDEKIPVYGQSGAQSGRIGTLTADQLAGRSGGVSTDAGTTHAFALSDSYIRFTSADPVTATVPLDGTVPIPVGKTITFEQEGAGQVTVAAAGGVTIHTPETLKTAKQHAVASLTKKAANLWILCGNLEAA